MSGEIELAPHRLRVALLQPQIAPNTGNIARLCAATGTELHLVRPMGFVLSDRQLRRSAMDYWESVKVTIHDDNDAFFKTVTDTTISLFSSKGMRSLWDAEFCDGDTLVFGSETAGIPETLRLKMPRRTVRIPQVAGQRCLNLSTAVGIGLFEALRQLNCCRVSSL